MFHKFKSPGIGAVLFLLTFNAFSQDLIQPDRYTASNKGKFFMSWGGNRAKYSKSDITFEGNDYKFTINNATAHDKPKGWHIDYINPKRLTNPQTNFKLGYFISDHYTVSLGLDHMKYVMSSNRHRVLDGYIDLPSEHVGSIYNGVYDQENFRVSEAFLQFEHTDGLNYIYAGMARYDDISSLFNIHNTDKIQLNVTEGFSAGLLYPKTNATLFNDQRYDAFHVSGFGISASAGLNLTFFKHFFIQGDIKGGYINMGDIRTTPNTSDSASQHFFFAESIFSIGGIFRV